MAALALGRLSWEGRGGCFQGTWRPLPPCRGPEARQQKPCPTPKAELGLRVSIWQQRNMAA